VVNEFSAPKILDPLVLVFYTQRPTYVIIMNEIAKFKRSNFSSKQSATCHVRKPLLWYN